MYFNVNARKYIITEKISDLLLLTSSKQKPARETMIASAQQSCNIQPDKYERYTKHIFQSESGMFVNVKKKQKMKSVK